MNANTKCIFPERISALREKKGVSRQTAADELGISRSSLEYYEKGQRVPDIVILSKIADYFEVSADYLLGRSEVASIDPSQKMKAACEFTGLSEKAVLNLKSAVERVPKIDTLICGISAELLNYLKEVSRCTTK